MIRDMIITFFQNVLENKENALLSDSLETVIMTPPRSPCPLKKGILIAFLVFLPSMIHFLAKNFQ